MELPSRHFQPVKAFIVGLLFVTICDFATGSAITLSGYISTGLGRVGIRINPSSGVIGYIHPDSPAARAGVQIGDRVVEVDGARKHFSYIEGSPGESVCIRVLRNGQYIDFNIVRVDVREIKP